MVRSKCTSLNMSGGARGSCVMWGGVLRPGGGGSPSEQVSAGLGNGHIRTFMPLPS